MATMLLIGSAIILTMKMNHKTLVPFLQYVNVTQCSQLGSRKNLEASSVQSSVFAELSYVKSKTMPTKIVSLPFFFTCNKLINTWRHKLIQSLTGKV